MLPDRQLTRDDLPFSMGRPITGDDLLAFVVQVVQPLWSQACDAILPMFGKVTSVDAGPPKTVTVADTFSGANVVCRYDSLLTPTVGVHVYGLRAAKQAVAIGTLA